MRARNKMIGALGAAAGIVLALSAAVAPASAAPTSGGTVTASASCASFEGLVVTGPSAGMSSVGMQTGEKITVTVSGAATGDKILLTAATGFSMSFASGAATSPFTFTAPASSVYSLSWTYTLASGANSTASRTWSFDCSTATGSIAPPTTTTADDDKDGVANTADKCAGTVLPDSVSRKVAGSYYANASKAFVDGTGRAANITVADAGGCSAAQIAKASGLSKSKSRSGISLSLLTSWANTH